MSLSTFETLPNEILMIIIRYSGDILTIFQAFFGLNQRINNILIDKRTHLFTDFLFINIDDYYNSDLFYDITKQLLSLKSIEKNNKQEFRRCLESLITFHIKYKYNKSIDDIELGLVHHQSLRMNLTDDELEKIDMELKHVFMDLQNNSKPMENIKQIQSLVLTKGARLKCINTEYVEYNFADAVNRLLIDNIFNNRSISQYFINSLVQMFKTLIISNLTLLHNRSYAVNGGCVIYFFLFYTIYKCQTYSISYKVPPLINIQYYRAIVDLLIFVLQCLNYESVEEYWWINHFTNLLDFICPIKLRFDQEIFIYTSQIEILKILFNENILNPPLSDIDPPYTLSKSLGNLFICYRLDLILTIFHYNEHIRNYFLICWNDPKFISILTGNSMRRRIFQSVLDDTFIGTWLATMTNLLFILLQKKEFKCVKKLFKQSPSLINRLDEDGNDPLLYICLKVRGCRERLIEYLIKKGCNEQRRNLNGENFIDTLKLERNRKLLKKLIEQEIIQINQDSDEITIHS